MAVDVTTVLAIARPREVVAAYAMDPDHAPDWYANIKSVAWQTPRPLQVGARIDFVAHFLGRRLAYTYEIVELIPGERLVMRTSQGPFPMETIYTFQRVDAHSTRMTLRNHGEPSGFSRILAPLLASAIRRANRKDLAALKRVLESSG